MSAHNSFFSFLESRVVSALNSVFNQWGISPPFYQWNISGEPCSGTAIGTSIRWNINSRDYNPGIKCDCNGTLCHITQLKVIALDVVGGIPEELWSLTSLNSLNLAQNYLTGPLSSSIANLTQMQWLNLGLNALSGEVPKELGKLTNLTVFYFDSSGVSGAIPSTFAALQNLQAVWGSDNEFTGSIPEFIGNWSKLSSLRISDLSNGSSSLEFLKDMTSLSTLILRNNHISGTIPSNIGDYQSLSQLDLSFNNLTGPIPDSLFNSSSLLYLFLGNNRLNGTPPALKSPLLHIDVSYNLLSAELPSWANNRRMQIILSNYFKACDLWDVVGEEPTTDLPRRMREEKEEKALRVLKKAIHLEIWKDIGETRSPSQVWKMLDCIASNLRGKYLLAEYWLQCFEEDKYKQDECGFKDPPFEVGDECYPIEAKELKENRVEGNLAKQNKHDDHQINGELVELVEEKEFEDIKETIVEVKAHEEETSVGKEDDAIEQQIAGRVEYDERKKVEIWKVKEKIQEIFDNKVEVGISNTVKNYGLEPCEFVGKITLLKPENGSLEGNFSSSWNSHIDLENSALDTGWWVNMDEFFEPHDWSVLATGFDCIQKNFPCLGDIHNSPKYSDFAINCGGPEITSSSQIVYEWDNETLGPATYYETSTKRWAVSNVGHFNDINNPQYTSVSSNQFTTSDTELLQTARISPGSLRYFGLGLENGNYNVTLQFAETTFLNPPTRKSLGRRVFDIYIQAWHVHENNREVELVDARLLEFDEEEVQRVIRVALLCTQTSPQQRPSMPRVVAMLLGDIEVIPVVAVHVSMSTASPFTSSFTPPFVALHGRYHHGRVPAFHRC
ncbi:hypothetical protein RHGRI_026941 [Rhododendron griersonianum]|uniref:non-specific serine/threonine protein kinase n=1 Tax=Rhododendron griersonianum TaxID=479676 RepID=A0AAV6IUN4_9ERIC|nr:hypothetical protein RHGRI_026941 [Rhododendron griersonianum]